MITQQTAVKSIPGVPDDLTQTAMCVRLVISRWDAQRTDKRVTREVAANHGSDEKMGRYQKNLINPDALEPIRKIADEMRAEHYRRTLPWLDGGTRVLSSAGYYDYTASMRALTARFDDARADLVVKYPQLVNEARVSLNGLFDPTEYPGQDEVERKFAAHARISNFPSAADFRVNMSAAERRVVQQQIEEDTRAAVQAAMADVWERLKKVVGAMAERLAIYSSDGDKVKGVFRDTLVENVRELVEVLPSLNIGRDAALDAFTDRVRETLLVHDAQTLREDLNARIDTQRAATQILVAMQDFV